MPPVKTGQYTIEDEVSGVKVESIMMMPLDIYRMSPRVVKVFLPVLRVQTALAKIVGKARNVTSRDELLALLLQIDLREVMPVFSEILDQLSLPENRNLPEELLARTQLHVRNEEGKLQIKQLNSAAEINDAFRGKLMLMLKVMWFSAVFNFADFFTGGEATAPISNSVK